jgi:hypothetical protein
MRSAARIAFGVCAVALLSIAALDGLLATQLGTCTMGSADSLVVGTASLPLAVAGFALLAHAPLSRAVLATLAPATAAFGYLAWWSVVFAFDVVARDAAACDVVMGVGPYPHDGRELALVAAYLVTSAVVVAGAAITIRRRLRS